MALWSREFLAYFRLPLAMVFVSVFLLLWMGFTWFVGNFMAADEAHMRECFKWLPWIYLFLIPAIGMRLWSEELRSGSWELLMSAPISPLAILAAKFLAGWSLIGVALLMSFTMPISIAYLGEPDWGPMLTGYAGAWLMGGAYLAVCLWASCKTQNQLIAFVLGALSCLCLILLGFSPLNHLLAALGMPFWMVDAIADFSFITRIQDFNKGLISFSSVAFFGLIIVFFLWLAVARIAHHIAFGFKMLGFAALIISYIFISKTSWQLDCTHNKLYSLSEPTRKFIRELKTPIEITFYFNRSMSQLPIQVKKFARRTQNTLERYAKISKGKIRFHFVDPARSVQNEKAALDAGIEPRGLNAGISFFLGMQAIQADRKVSLSHIQAHRESFLEFDITRSLWKLQQTRKPTIFILSRLPLLSEPKAKTDAEANAEAETQNNKGKKTPRKLTWYFLQRLGLLYQVKSIEAHQLEAIHSSKKPPELIILLHPPSLTPRQVSSLKQWLDDGKPLLGFVDPLCFFEKKNPSVEGQATGFSSDLGGLLEELGIIYDKTKVVADLENSSIIPSPDGGIAYPIILELSDFDSSVPTVSKLSKMHYRAIGSFTIDPKASFKATTILESSPESGQLRVSSIPFIAPALMASRVQVQGAMKLAGRFEGLGANAKGSLSLVCDVDFLTNEAAARQVGADKKSTTWTSLNNNADFGLNLVDAIIGESNLQNLRAKSATSHRLEGVHTFYRVLREENAKTMKVLRSKQESLRRKQIKLYNSKIQSLGLPKETAKAIEDLRIEQIGLKQQINEARNQFRTELRRFEMTLALTNTLGPSLFFAAFCCLYLMVRKYKSRP